MRYRRANSAGETHFFTLALAERKSALLIEHVDRLREVVAKMRQRRYWEHQIRDDQDLQAHMDYIHYNPVKHGYVERTSDWPYSSIHRYILMGWLNADWGVHEKSEEDGRFGE